MRRPHGMKDWLITFTLAGEGYVRVGGEEYRCRAGDVGVLRGESPHEYGTVRGEHWHFLWAHFPAWLPEAKLLEMDDFYLTSIDSERTHERIVGAFQRMLEDARLGIGRWEALCETALRELLLLAAESQTGRMDPRVEQVLRLLSSRMTETLRMEELAGAVGLSVSRLSHLFKEATGESVLEALNRMRIRQAAQLLEHTGRTATEAAHDVGFHNYNHFAAQFRKRMGVSPRAYKSKQLDKG